MKFTTITSFVYFFLCSFFTVFAAPLESRDVYAPQILYPNADTVWIVGQRHNVTWDVSDPPKEITNLIGKIFLRKGNITTRRILACDFSILLGRIEIVVPLVEDGHNYSLVLLGDSGDFSQQFTIKFD